MTQAAAPAGYDEEVAPPPDVTAAPKGYDEEVSPPADVAAATPAQPDAPPDSVLGGFVRRGTEAVKGLASTFGPLQPGENAFTSIPGVRMAKGLYQGAKQAYGQAQGQFGQAVEAAKAGDIPGAALRYGQAMTTGLSMADPLATGPVTNINQKEAEGRAREAIGAGTFDALSMLVGKKSAEKAPASTTKLNKLAYATGAQSIRPLEHLLPEIEETVRQNGQPKTVGQFIQTIQDTSSRLENQFNTSLQQMGNQPIHTQAIADALKAKADALPRSAELEANALRQEARLYDGQVTTARELNADRMYRSDNLQSFYNKSLTGQMAAARSSAQTMADKIVYDGARDILYDEMDRRFPGQDFQELKRKQSSVLDMLGDAKNHVERLEAAQAKKAGAPLSEKAQVSASAHAGGSIVTPRFHGLLNLLPGGGPLVHANSAVSSAFNPSYVGSMASAIPVATRAAILTLPVASLVTKRAPAVPPPPAGGENEQRPQQ